MIPGKLEPQHAGWLQLDTGKESPEGKYEHKSLVATS
jgi:hypothetical protein